MFLALVVVLIVIAAVVLWRAFIDLDEEAVPGARDGDESGAEVLPVDLSDRD